MAEPWTTLGVVLIDSVFKEVLLKIGKQALEDYLKDFFKDSIKQGVALAKPEALKKALGEALQQFLKLVEDQLIDCDLTGAEIRDGYEIRIGQFLRDEEVKPLLGKAFEKDCKAIDADKLRAIWVQRFSPDMPTGFDWNEVANQYVKEVKRIIKKSAELKALLELEIQESIDKNITEIVGIIPDFDRKKYQEGLLECYGNLKLDTLDTTGCAYNELKLWRIFIAQNVRQVHELLPQTYEIPKEHQRRLRASNQLEAEIELEELERYKQIYEQQPIRSVGEIIKDKENYRYVVILGDPGSGKSTLLQYLALDWANSSPETAISQPIPLLIELRTYIRNRDSGQCKNFLEFIHNSSILCCVGANSYAFVHRTFLEYFCAWEFVWQFKETQTLTIEELKTEVFGKHWQDETWHEVLRLIAGMIDTSFAGEIIEYLISLNGEAEQFINLFLAAKCLSDVRNPSSIASTGIKLLKQLKSLIKYGWDYIYGPPTDEQDLVRKIHTQVVVVVATTWKDDPDTLPWLKSLAQSYEREPDVSDAAVQALAQGWKDDPDTLPWLKFLAQSYEGEPGSCLSDAAVQALAQGWKDDPDTLPLLKSLAQSHEDGSVRSAAVQALAQNWKDDPDTLPLLKSLAQSDKSAWVRRTAVKALAQGWKDNLDTLAIVKSCAVSDVHEWVREPALQALARGWKDEPWLFEFLCDRAVNDPSKEDGFWADNPRQTALKAIIEQYPDHPQTLRLLHERANNDPDEEVRRVAVQELARGWKDDPDTLPFLKTRALSDDNYAVRCAAVQELAKGWKDDPDTLPLLKQRATSDDDSDVRRAAVRELAKGWKDEPGLFEFLYDRALNDPFERQEDWEDTPEDWEDNPRQLALEIIINQYRDHPRTLPLLQDRAENDPDEKVREFAALQAVQVLAQGWKDDPDTLPLLKSLAQSNENARVRKAAVQALAQGWKDEPWMFEFLYDRAVNDPFERKGKWEGNPRQIALEAIIEQRPDSPQALSLLRDRAENDPDEQLRKFARKKLAKLEE